MGRKTYDAQNGRRRPGGYQCDFGQLLAEMQQERAATRPARHPQTPGRSSRQAKDQRA